MDIIHVIFPLLICNFCCSSHFTVQFLRLLIGPPPLIPSLLISSSNTLLHNNHHYSHQQQPPSYSRICLSHLTSPSSSTIRYGRLYFSISKTTHRHFRSKP
ncbi:hypothetical protein Hanom_Chr15g01340681 [Helianthus anomalus]